MNRIKLFLYELNELCFKYDVNITSSLVSISNATGELYHDENDNLKFIDSLNGEVFQSTIDRKVDVVDYFSDYQEYLDDEIDYDCI